MKGKQQKYDDEGRPIDEHGRVLNMKSAAPTRKPKINRMYGMVRMEASRLQMRGLGRGKYVVDSDKPTEVEKSKHVHPRHKR